MAMTNEQTLKQIVNKGGVSASSVALFNKAILNPEQAGRFLREVTEDQPVLKEASVITMKSHTKNLDRVAVDGRVLHSGYDAETGLTRVLEDGEKVKIATKQNQLLAQKLKTQAIIEDDDLEDGLEGKEWTNTLMSLIGEQVGSDQEVWGLGADAANITAVEDDLLHTATGWLPKAGNKVYDIDVSNDGIEALFDAMIAATPKKFIKNRNMMRFYVPYDYEKLYRDELKSRGTPLGDTTIQGFNQLTYENIPVVHVPSLDDEKLKTLYATPLSLLSLPANMVMGIYRQIGIEPERHAAKEETEYILTMRADVNYLNEMMATASFAELSQPAPAGG